MRKNSVRGERTAIKGVYVDTKLLPNKVDVTAPVDIESGKKIPFVK